MHIEDIEKLAELSKIELTQAEKEAILKDLDSILGYVKQIESVDVPDIEVDYKNRNIWREDEVTTGEFSREEMINQFPDSHDGFVKVKKIL